VRAGSLTRACSVSPASCRSRTGGAKAISTHSLASVAVHRRHTLKECPQSAAIELPYLKQSQPSLIDDRIPNSSRAGAPMERGLRSAPAGHGKSRCPAISETCGAKPDRWHDSG
jgi:hypothetical protein